MIAAGKTHALLFGVFVVLLTLDLSTKYATSTLSSPIEFGIFAIEYTENTGAGFGILQEYTTFLLMFGFVVLGFLLYYYSIETEFLPRFWMTLIGAGTVGNLWNRLTLGYVIDFIRVGWWPNFNVADSVIVIGGAGLLWWIYKHEN